MNTLHKHILTLHLTYTLDRILKPIAERTAVSHPNQEKATLIFLMLYFLKQRCPDVLCSFRGSCPCLTLPKTELLLQLSKQKLSFHPVLLLLQVISCSYYSYNENFLPTQRESLSSKRHTGKRHFIFNTLRSATSTIGQQSETTARTPGFHSTLSLKLQKFPSFLTHSHLPLFGFFSSKWKRKGEGEYLKP